MKLWLITRKDDVGYDEYSGHVIAADTAPQARNMAAEMVADEPASEWTSAKASRCTCIAEDCEYLEPTVVLSDYRAG